MKNPVLGLVVVLIAHFLAAIAAEFRARNQFLMTMRTGRFRVELVPAVQAEFGLGRKLLTAGRAVVLLHHRMPAPIAIARLLRRIGVADRAENPGIDVDVDRTTHRQRAGERRGDSWRRRIRS